MTATAGATGADRDERDDRRGEVIHEADVPWHDLGAGARIRQPIDATTGCRNLVQRVLRLPRGHHGPWQNAASEDAVYVVEGRGEATVSGEPLLLEPGTGLYVPPGATYSYRNDRDDHLTLVSVLSPPPADLPGTPLPGRARTVHERDQEDLSAGEDRHFKVMIDPRVGCRNLTQFLGFIDRSRAPLHTHTYEEAIYVLAGEGIVHIGHREVPIEPGASVFLPTGVPHCLENASEGVLRLLGVFSPAGSPADKAPQGG